MPNYITNILHLKAKREILEKICPDSKTFSFALTVPYPEDQQCKYADLELGNNWYIKNWGTKWNAINPSVTMKTATEITLTFDTAWSPPNIWLQKIHVMFPTLRFHLVWVDEDFPTSGYIYTKNKVIKSREYKHNDEKAYAFVKKHFPELYESEMKLEKFYKIIKKVRKT